MQRAIGRAKEKKYSWILIVSSIMIGFWIGFLAYCWQAGLIFGSRKKEIVVRLISAENSFQKGLIEVEKKLQHMAIPVEYVSGSPIISKESAIGGITSPKDYDFHVIFSTDCSPYQDWQTLVVFHSAMVVGQKGPVTRIASGCDVPKKKELSDLYKTLFPSYHVHFTPDFKRDEKTNKKYDFYNKPWGVKHWLENAVPAIPDDIVVALIDPDMIFVRPLTTQVRGQPNNLYGRYLKPGDIPEKIVEGRPVAQMYGLGAPWANDRHLKFNRTYICGFGSPCLRPTVEFGEKHYSVGPPYMVHKKDMTRIAATWTKFVPRVFEGYPHLLAEMYAYSMAAAHEDLPHLQMEQHMVSNTDAGGEGWPLIDVLDRTCLPPDEHGVFYPGLPLPSLVHYCQNFRAGDIVFAKRAVRRDIFSCEAPMFLELPVDLDKSDYRIHKHKKESMKKLQVKRNSFNLCVIHRSINAALAYYKQKMCTGGTPANYQKSYISIKE